ncbi:MAG TPA: 16S rRNA (adenine(1518)-N(6)/adenine(1519)-N(6))-dimethyltransferase RsmA [Burkholderiales bacterium]|nr:16S rRNA (adenine(1518)-N(6)/adenine(1519)-N(6))-dimethyltransferase RsmA [Burkholderiales bacterium]
METAKHRPRRRFGQHFLHDPRVIARIVAAIDPKPCDAIVEIGPGLGALTAPLAERVPQLHVVELDRDLAQRLRAGFPSGRLVVHTADALRFDFGALPAGLRVVGNLPYNISTPLLFRLAAFAPRLRDLHFMLQKEVVERMVAAPSTSEYGRLSVMLQYRFEMMKLFDVGAGAFRPSPQVDSAVVRMIPHPVAALGAHDEQMLGRVVTAAFTKRRKTLRNALDGVVDESGLSALGIDPRLRPENLGVEDYIRIANAVVVSRAG